MQVCDKSEVRDVGGVRDRAPLQCPLQRDGDRSQRDDEQHVGRRGASRRLLVRSWTAVQRPDHLRTPQIQGHIYIPEHHSFYLQTFKYEQFYMSLKS